MLVYKNILKSRHYQVYQVLINKTILASLMDLILPWSGGKRCRQCKQEQEAGESDAAEVLTLRAKCSQALMRYTNKSEIPDLAQHATDSSLKELRSPVDAVSPIVFCNGTECSL